MQTELKLKLHGKLKILIHITHLGNAFTVPSGQGGYYNVGFFINWKDSWSAQVIQYIRVNGSVKATFMELKLVMKWVRVEVKFFK